MILMEDEIEKKRKKNRDREARRKRWKKMMEKIEEITPLCNSGRHLFARTLTQNTFNTGKNPRSIRPNTSTIFKVVMSKKGQWGLHIPGVTRSPEPRPPRPLNMV